MPNQTTSAARTDRTTAVGDDVSRRAAEIESDVRSQISDSARTVKDAIDETRRTASSSIKKAASAVRATANELHLGRDDFNRIARDVTTVIKNNPGPSLLVAAAIGFIVGRSMTHD
jgi:ElaB/YqjD/DUF883 family membrane-anchored ribosome-binding protein